jgi:hypothetical protein
MNQPESERDHAGTATYKAGVRVAVVHECYWNKYLDPVVEDIMQL